MEQHLESTANPTPTCAPNPSEVGEVKASTAQDMSSESYRDRASENTVTSHQLPIPPASEPMQYRAIGLIQGTYVPSEEQFTRGTLMTDDDDPVDAVLLGRVMSLVKKHVDLTVPHLWVVYPRTRPKNEHLHAQIVGIWEPDNLHRDFLDDGEALAEGDETSNVDVAVIAGEPQVGVAPADSSGTDSEDAAQPAQASIDQPSDLRLTSETETSEQDEGLTAESEISAKTTEPDDTANFISPDEEETTSDAANVAVHDSASLLSEETSEAPIADDSAEVAASKLIKPSRPKFSAAAAQVANVAVNVPSSNDPQEGMVEASSVPTESSPNQRSQPVIKDGYFSVRGEVLQFSPEHEQITIRIRQASRKTGGSSSSDKAKNDEQEKEFKLQLQGRLEGRTVGYFWDLHVQRNGSNLVVFDSNMIGVVPPRKNRRKKGVGGPLRGRGSKRRFEGGRQEERPSRSGDRPTSPARRAVGSKPVLKKNSASNVGQSSGSDE